MSFKNDVKSVLVELSPILAGFKLAVIVIGYFGLGSVAKWVISYWYPFTRWVWDSVANLLYLPIFPVIVKDSLTALIFFLPLGGAALWRKVAGRTGEGDSHRVLGAAFGSLFLIIICKDVLQTIAESLASPAQDLIVSLNRLDYFVTIFGMFVMVVIILYGSMVLVSRYTKFEGVAVLSKFRIFH